MRAERKFFRVTAWLYAPLDDLEALRDALRAEIHKKKNPLYVDLLDDEPPKEIAHAHAQQRAKLRSSSRPATSRATTAASWSIVCRPPGGLFAERAGEKLAEAAERSSATRIPSATTRRCRWASPATSCRSSRSATRSRAISAMRHAACA